MSKVMESNEVCDYIYIEAKEVFAFTNHIITAKLF